MHAQRRGDRSRQIPFGCPHDVVHPAQREPGLIAGPKASAPQRLPVPTRFPQRAGYHGQRAQRAAVVVQFGRAIRHPADQPDVEFVVAVQPREPAVVGRRSAYGQQVVVAARQHVVGVAVGGLQQVGQPQSGRRRYGGDGRRQHSRAVRKPCGTPEMTRTDRGSALRPTTLPCRTRPHRSRVAPTSLAHEHLRRIRAGLPVPYASLSVRLGANRPDSRCRYPPR